MIVPGYCNDCKKIKQVRVSGAGMVRLAQGGVASGQCTTCAQAEADQARARWEARRGR